MADDDDRRGPVDGFPHGLTIGSAREPPDPRTGGTGDRARRGARGGVGRRAGHGIRAVAVGRAHVGDGWSIGHALNGGMLMALATHALGEGVSGGGHADPLTWSATFLSAAVPGEVEVHVEVVRVGRGLSTAQARLVQQGDTGPVERVRLSASFGDVGRDRPGAPVAARAPQCRDPKRACLPPVGPRHSPRPSPCWTASTCGSTRRPRGSRWGSPRVVVSSVPGSGCATVGSRTSRCFPTPSTPSCRSPSTSECPAGRRRWS